MDVEVAQPPPDRAIAELAGGQDGVVSRRQLLELGLGREAIANRGRRGSLIAVHRGVYAVGHRRLTIRGQWWAALLAVGEGAVLSHGAAAAVWDLRHTPTGDIDVSTPKRSGRSKRPGIRLHRSSTLSPADAVVHDGIPVTSAARTILDLAGVLPRRELERVLDRAEQLRLFDLRALEGQIAAGQSRPAAATLKGCLAEHTVGSTLTESETEERFLALVDKAGLERPAINEWLVLGDGTALRPDCMWRDRRLIVELDGFGPHSTRRALRTDRRRDRKLHLEGWKVLRFTYDDVTEDPDGVVAELRAHTS